MRSHTNFDWNRKERTGVPEVVLAERKTVTQVLDIVATAADKQSPLLITRLTPTQMDALSDTDIELDEQGRTATFLMPAVPDDAAAVAIVTGGTSDLPVANEALVSARFFGLNAALYPDVGVAGLWRLESIAPELAHFQVLIAIAGMEGALFSVLAGLSRAPVIAVPSSVGYGVSAGGQTALHAALASCAPGLVTVNIDNGFGAAAAAAKILSIRAPLGAASA